MKVLIVGGTGFVGLNIAETLLAAGHEVVLFDRAPLPDAARADFERLSGSVTVVRGDVTDAAAIAAVVTPGTDVVVLGAAITAGATRDSSEPSTILQVNLLAQVPILQAAAAAKVRRVINLSSAAAYGLAGERVAVLDEETPGEPVGLYAITKWASERVGMRLASLWDLDFVSVRLSGLFGPWERATGVRDTLSPHCQILAAAQAGRPALLARPGLRDWTYAPDVGKAVTMLAQAEVLDHRLYNVSRGEQASALSWGEALARDFPGFVCRLVEPGEAATIDLHGPGDRAPLGVVRLLTEFGWRAPTSSEASAHRLAAWAKAHREEAA